MVQPSDTPKAAPADIEAGRRCMLCIMDRQFLVEIMHVNDDTVRVSFPLNNFPLNDMQAVLEFHDEQGFNRYPVLVLQGPSRLGEGVLLARPEGPQRNQHRSSFRVPTDLTAQVRDQVHVRRFDAEIVDLSEGGALLRTSAPFEFGATLEVSLSLPGEAVFTLLAQIAHVSQAADQGGTRSALFGTRFLSVDPEAEEALTRYVHQRIRELRIGMTTGSPDAARPIPPRQPPRP